MKRFSSAILAAALCAAISSTHAQSSALPKSGIRLLVPFAASGPIDFSARVLADGMRANLGIPVIVDNRVGANGAIAAVAVKNGPTDGSQLLVATSGMLTISPHIEKDLPYDAAKDFTALAPMTYVDVTLAVGSQLGVKNLKEFVELARKSSPPLALGSFGIGNVSHGWIELFKDAAKVNLLHVPYKGAAPAFQDVLAGRIAGTFPAFSIAMPQIKSGKVVALGVVGHQRSPVAPDIPTLEEQGYPGIDFLTWNALMGPKNMPAEVVAAIRASMSAALKSEDVKSKLISAGITPWTISPGEFTRSVGVERERWRKLIVEKKIFGDQ
jgi:tripartite-type tricarboxylate transporter receptor subunit TctC